MTIVGPDVLTLEKSGPETMTIGTSALFTLDVHNTGSAPAWNPTITDRLPDTPLGGTCDAPPTEITAQVFEENGAIAVSDPLIEGTDFSVDFSGAPGCELGVTMLSAAGAIGPDQRLIVTYQARLDPDSQDGAALTNVAGATEWFSTDGTDPNTADDRRT
ncbi:MAG: hypothetical protein GWN79_17250, partial [Actinobacteria bacterium]|nr:hypothetical protein [Actinomycetota bacterium]NIV57227.1 hypothetical protein [Actinomycetota bacterium]NIV88714.1 hypothetical protein [Actinomycetota bacterium]